MPLPSSGNAISLDQMHVEVGGTSGTTCSINDSDIRGLIPGRASGALSRFSDFHGRSASHVHSSTMTVGSLDMTSSYGGINYGFNDMSGSGIFNSTLAHLIIHHSLSGLTHRSSAYDGTLWVRTSS